MVTMAQSLCKKWYCSNCSVHHGVELAAGNNTIMIAVNDVKHRLTLLDNLVASCHWFHRHLHSLHRHLICKHRRWSSRCCSTWFDIDCKKCCNVFACIVKLNLAIQAHWVKLLARQDSCTKQVIRLHRIRVIHCELQGIASNEMDKLMS